MEKSSHKKFGLLVVFLLLITLGVEDQWMGRDIYCAGSDDDCSKKVCADGDKPTCNQKTHKCVCKSPEPTMNSSSDDDYIRCFLGENDSDNFGSTSPAQSINPPNN
ncbi:hypothetical protein L484_026513 [Morus notabilis]|uniref:Uncharacterized protein n=1 Tax=Morus notabilis TaxID=981085 RepID=W9QNU0_9ROSA|nr:hypothetical protein L484_026513 [Morus notabilis]